MRKKMFTVMAALCSLVVANAADVTDYTGLKAALSSGETEIKLAVGTYVLTDGALDIPAGTTVTGGWDAAFSKRTYPGEATDKSQMTILDGNALLTAVPSDKHRVAKVSGTLEGVMIRNGHVRDDNGGGVWVENNGLVLNCIIKGNVAMTVAGTTPSKGGGAYLNGANAQLVNCVIAYNMANNGYGVAGSGKVVNNTITANTYAPETVLVPGTSYQHFAHWRSTTGSPNPADLDPQTIQISAFRMATTQTTTSQYAVFAAAMDLTANGADISFESVTFDQLYDPITNGKVTDRMNFAAAGGSLFKQAGQSNFGLRKVGADYIYYDTHANDAMTFVSWYGALAYSVWLGGTLPTEGQWELAARHDGTSGVTATLYAGSDEAGSVAWYTGNSGSTVHEVAGKVPNALGLYDMSGNVWEWCADYINTTDEFAAYPTYGSLTDPLHTTPMSGSSRVLRGGGWSSTVSSLALAYRSYNTPATTSSSMGLRPVLVP